MKKFKKIWKIISGIIIFIVCIYIAFVIYSSIYYKADDYAKECFNSSDIVTISEEKDYLAFVPNDYSTGIILYPGAKVEALAYAPLMYELAKNNIACYIIKMPYNLAFFGINRANKIIDKNPDINWYLMGHSLGGALASSYADKNFEKLDGLILLASYSTKDLCDNDIPILSIYGSNDKVLNMDKYEIYKNNISKNLSELVIAGGCHAYFGSYGKQKNDGVATITKEEQINITVNEINKFIINENGKTS